MHDPTRWLAVLAIVGILGVLYGGWALLTFITAKPDLNAAQARFFRAGHAHAGVLLVLGLVYFRYLPETDLSDGLQWALGLLLLTGVLAQSGGFFLHLAAKDLDRPSAGTKTTRAGAFLIAAALLGLAGALAMR